MSECTTEDDETSPPILRPHQGAWHKFAYDQRIKMRTVHAGFAGRFPIKGEYAVIHATAHLLSGEFKGKKLFCTREEGSPFTFRIGERISLGAIGSAVETMKLGEICELIAPIDMLFAGETYKARVELVHFYRYDVSNQNDRSAVVHVVSEGMTLHCPTRGYTCTIRLSASHAGDVFDDRQVTYILGEYSEAKLPRGVDRAIAHLSMHAIAQIRVSGASSLSDELYEHFGLEKGSILEYMVDVKNFDHYQPIQPVWTFDKQMKHIDAAKRRANTNLLACHLETAIEMYTRLAVELTFVVTENKNQQSQVTKRKLIMALNSALAYIHRGSTIEAMISCEVALGIEPRNEKGLFRKAEANRMHGCYAEALRALMLLKEVNPKHSQVAQRIAFCENELCKIRLTRLLEFQPKWPAIDWVESQVVESPASPEAEEKKQDKKRKKNKKKD